MTDDLTRATPINRTAPSSLTPDAWWPRRAEHFLAAARSASVVLCNLGGVG